MQGELASEDQLAAIMKDAYEAAADKEKDEDGGPHLICYVLLTHGHPLLRFMNSWHFLTACHFVP